LKEVKNAKVAGVDGNLPEFLKNLSSIGISWLASLSTSIAETCDIPKFLHEAKVITLLKQGKPAHDPQNYRPISLLSTTCK